MPRQFNILIVGAGIAGLCTSIALARQGHRITVLESAHELSPAGAGIHLPPNATLLLKEWGILDQLAEKAVVPRGFKFRRYGDSRVLASAGGVGGNDRKGEGLGTPYWSVKRADYQAVLHQAALSTGCYIRLGAKVTGLNEDAPSVTLATGEILNGDLIVVADGMKSALRQLILSNEDVSPLPYPMSTYRAWAPTAALTKTNSTVATLIAEPASNVWLGPGRHVILYPAESGAILTINGTYPSRTDVVGAWNKEVRVEEVQAQFAMFDPLVKAVLAEARDCKSWALAEVPRLSRWRSKSGNVVLVGDAAHGMLQFLAQGAAMATEDAGALAECLKTIESKDGVPGAMWAYERARKFRCERVQAGARRNGEVIHMFDGEEQECRDRKMTGEAQGKDEEVNCGPLLDERFTRWLYGHDVLEHTRKVLHEANRTQSERNETMRVGDWI